MVWVEKKAREVHVRYLEKHRQNKQSVKTVSRAMTAIGVIGPFSTSIQAAHIFATKVVAGISPLSWIGYTFVSFCWLFYGFFHKDRPMVIVNTLSLLMNISILTGYLLFS